MALSSNTKKILIFSSIASAGLLSYLAFKLGRKQEFVDNVWCADPECSNVNPQTYGTTSGANGYSSASGYSNASGNDSPNTGNVNLLFREPHNLEAGDLILIKQTGDSAGNITYPEYDGWVRVSKPRTPYIVSLDTARIGSSPIEGGSIQSESWVTRTF